jgi:putative (di)nucleoside polyphosphate hydrolase
VIAEAPDWYNYDLQPELLGQALKGRFKGQTQRWFLMQFTGTDADIDITADDHQEFSEWRWADIDELVDLIVAFKRPVYRQVVSAFRDQVIALAG